MVYSNSCEEHKYLAGIRREKEAFERLIKERGVCGFSYHFVVANNKSISFFLVDALYFD
jgi:hypothetical protein